MVATDGQREKGIRRRNMFCFLYGRNVMSVQMLEVSLSGIGSVLRLEMGAWSTVK